MADFQLHKAAFDAIDTEIIALSVDRADDARALAEQLGVAFSMLHDVDADVMARTIGTYTGVRKGRHHMQPAAFVLKRDGTVVHAVYSSGKVGRLTSHDVLALLADLRD